MDAAAVARALEDARFDAQGASRHEDLAADERRRAKLAEWERIDQLLTVVAPGTVYDPDTDDVVQAELATEAAAVAEREATVREAQRIAGGADELQALRELGTLERAAPREGDEDVRDELTRRAGWHVQADIDAWLARALAAHRGHYADPAARETTAGFLPQPVLAHAALLSALAPGTRPAVPRAAGPPPTRPARSPQRATRPAPSRPRPSRAGSPRASRICLRSRWYSAVRPTSMYFMKSAAGTFTRSATYSTAAGGTSSSTSGNRPSSSQLPGTRRFASYGMTAACRSAAGCRQGRAASACTAPTTPRPLAGARRLADPGRSAGT